MSHLSQALQHYTMADARDARGRRPAQVRFRERLAGRQVPGPDGPKSVEPILIREPDADWKPLLSVVRRRGDA